MGAPEESRAAGAGERAEEARGGAPAQGGLSTTEKHTREQDAAVQSGWHV